MMTCSECGTSLDDVPEGDPCPTCGSSRRDAIATPDTVHARASIPEAQGMTTCSECGKSLNAVPDADQCPTCGSYRRTVTITVSPATVVTSASDMAHALESAVVGTPERTRALVKARKVTVRWTPPHPDALGWFVELLDDDEVVGVVQGEEVDDAALGIAMEWHRYVGGGDELLEPGGDQLE
jgi:Zn finger protein HypA/HybF involved in hydrogenase expression